MVLIAEVAARVISLIQHAISITLEVHLLHIRLHHSILALQITKLMHLAMFTCMNININMLKYKKVH